MVDISNTILGRADIFVPAYLTPQQEGWLRDALNQFPDSFEYYLSPQKYPNELLQGDAWANLGIINIETLERKNVRGIILSNSCDVDLANKRDWPPSLMFCPLISLDKFVSLLRGNGKGGDYIEQKLALIRRQEITSIFYLPGCPKVIEESIAFLDDIHTCNVSKLFDSANPAQKIVSLSMQGFYLFLVKLSIHFCRFNEKVTRFD